MGFQALSPEDVRIVAECLRAAVAGPYFEDWEFHTLFGLERAEVDRVSQAWPDVDVDDETVGLAVNNSLANLAGYPHGESLATFTTATVNQLFEILERWRV